MFVDLKKKHMAEGTFSKYMFFESSYLEIDFALFILKELEHRKLG